MICKTINKDKTGKTQHFVFCSVFTQIYIIILNHININRNLLLEYGLVNNM